MLWLQASPPPSGGLSGDVIRGLAGGVLGLVATMITLIAGWARDRSESATRVSDIDEATKVVLFWKTWIETSEKLTPVLEDSEKARAQSQLALASHRVESLVAFKRSALQREHAQGADLATKKSGLSIWRKALLLYVPPRKRGWIPRVLFYIYVVMLVVGLTDTDMDDRDALLIGSAVIVVFSWMLSVWLEKPKISG